MSLCALGCREDVIRGSAGTADGEVFGADGFAGGNSIR